MVTTHLATITKISSMMSFNVPLDTLFTLMSGTVFTFSRQASSQSVSDRQSLEVVISLVVKACTQKTQAPSFSLFHLDNFTTEEKQQRWQVLVSCFLTVAVTTYIDINADWSDKQSSNIMEQISSLIHFYSTFTCTKEDSDSSITTALKLHTARAVSLSLCRLLRLLSVTDESSLLMRQGEGKQEEDATKMRLMEDITEILRFSLKKRTVVVSGGLGAGPVSLEVCCCGQQQYRSSVFFACGHILWLFVMLYFYLLLWWVASISKRFLLKTHATMSHYCRGSGACSLLTL